MYIYTVIKTTVDYSRYDFKNPRTKKQVAVLFEEDTYDVSIPIMHTHVVLLI